MRARLLLLMALAGCGAGGDPGGGDDGLPNPGYAPYTLLEDESGALRSLFPTEPTLSGPFARVEDGHVALYLSRCDGPSPCEIVRATASDGVNFGVLEIVATHANGLRDPFVVRGPSGDELWAVDGPRDGLVRFARQGNGRFGDPTLFEAVNTTDVLGSPSVLFLNGDRHVYWIQKNTTGSVMLRWTGPASETMTPDTARPISLDICSESPCWSDGIVSDGEVRSLQTATGQRRLRMLLTSSTVEGGQALGYAASSGDGRWSTYAFNPTIQSDAHLAQGSQIRFGSRYLVYAVAGRQVTKIIVAINDLGHPSATW